MEFLVLLLPLLTQLLPLILNKPTATAKTSFLRRMARYEKLAADPGATLQERMAFGELADLFACCAEADEDGLQQIAAGIAAASADAKAMMAASGKEA